MAEKVRIRKYKSGFDFTSWKFYVSLGLVMLCQNTYDKLVKVTPDQCDLRWDQYDHGK